MPFLPEQAASFAGEVDALFLFILTVTGLVAIGIWVAVDLFASRATKTEQRLDKLSKKRAGTNMYCYSKKARP